MHVGKLRGWLKSPADVAEELDIDMEEAKTLWDTTKGFKILPSIAKNLLPETTEPEEKKEEAESKATEDEVELVSDVEKGTQTTLFDFAA